MRKIPNFPSWIYAPIFCMMDPKRPPSTNNNPRRPSWDYYTWQDYQNSLAGFVSHITYTYAICTTLVNTLRSMVVHPKDKTPKEHRCGIIYTSRVTLTVATHTSKTLSQRFKEHTNLDKPTGVVDHCRATGHSLSMKNTKVLTCEFQLTQEKSEGGYIYQTKSSYHEQRPGIPSACHLQPNYSAENLRQNT